MSARIRRQTASLAAVAMLLLLCLAMAATTHLLVHTLASPGGPVHNLTVGTISCPHSVIAGWTLGHDWNTVTDVVTCTQPEAPTMWVLLSWSDGRRTSLCLDLTRRRC